MKSSTRHHLGLTLVELVVAVGLFATLTLAITRVFLRVMDVQQKITDQQNLEGDFRYALNVFAAEVQKSTKPVAALDCVGVTCDAGKYFCTSADKKTLCIMDKNGIWVKYFIDGNGQLTVLRGATSYTITSKDIKIDELAFELITPQKDVVSLRAKLRANKADGDVMYYQTAISN